MSRLPVDPAQIRLLAEILSDTGLSEIEISEGEIRVRVARAAPVAYAPPAQAYPQPGYAPAALQAPQAAASPAGMPQAQAPAAAAPAADLADHPGAVTSPMVGIAYLTPEPGAPDFVTLGQVVSAGQTLLLIEAMKTFNQIKAPKAGRVSAILVASGSPVEFGEVLAVID